MFSTAPRPVVRQVAICKTVYCRFESGLTLDPFRSFIFSFELFRFCLNARPIADTISACSGTPRGGRAGIHFSRSGYVMADDELDGVSLADQHMIELPAEWLRTQTSRRALDRQVQADRERRQEAYFQKLATRALQKAPTLKLLAEGDSWFEYPLDKGGVISHLERLIDIPINNMAHHGDEVRQMLGLKQRDEIERRLQSLGHNVYYDALLFSGGGNDFAGDPFVLWLNDFDGDPADPAAVAATDPATLLDTERFDGVLDIVTAGYQDLIEIRDRLSPPTHLFFHGYDFAKPDGRGVCGQGPWLKPGFEKRRIPESLRRHRQADDQSVRRAHFRAGRPSQQRALRAYAWHARSEQALGERTAPEPDRLRADRREVPRRDGERLAESDAKADSEDPDDDQSKEAGAVREEARLATPVQTQVISQPPTSSSSAGCVPIHRLRRQVSCQPAPQGRCPETRSRLAGAERVFGLW
ncbi:MAG: hypothetical protein QM770_16985 [Tepidisphaeraceae bacterium]